MKKMKTLLLSIVISLSGLNAQQMIKDISIGSNDSYPYNFKKLNNSQALFVAGDTTHGRELWITDASSIGTTLVLDIDPGYSDSYPNFIDTIGGKMVFWATTSATGRELWVTDGTAAGTGPLADINPGSANSSNYDLFAGHAGNKIFVIAESALGGMELYATDGTPAGTVLIKDICAGSGDGIGGYYDQTAVVGNKLYFSSYGTTCNGRELWVSDGTLAGTYMVKSFGNLPHGLRETYPGHLSFAAYNSGTGTEMYVSDGTSLGTVLATYGDINLGANSSNPQNFIHTSSGNYFTADDGITGKEWHSVNSTVVYSQSEIVPGNAGPIVSKTFEPTSTSFYSNGYYFTANDYIHGVELYSINPFTNTIGLLKDINPSGSSAPDYLTYVTYNEAIFVADDGVHGAEMWVTDGSPSGTRMITDIMAGYQSSVYSNVALINGKLVFGAKDQSSGIELFAVNFSQVLEVDHSFDYTEIAIFPNPIQTNFNIQLPVVLTSETYLSLFNTMGQEVMQVKLNPSQNQSYQIEASSLNAGIYFGRMVIGNNQYGFKLIKE